MKQSLLEYMLNEITIDVDENDPNALMNAKRAMSAAKRNPRNANRLEITTSKANLMTAQRKENSPTKAVDIKIARLKQQMAVLNNQKQQLLARKRVKESVDVIEDVCEVVYTNQFDEVIHNGSVLSESAISAFKRTGNVVKRQYRCTSGKKVGKIVANPNDCNKTKNRKRVKAGRISARKHASTRIQKTKVSKKKSISLMVSDLNKRLKG